MNQIYPAPSRYDADQGRLVSNMSFSFPEIPDDRQYEPEKKLLRLRLYRVFPQRTEKGIGLPGEILNQETSKMSYFQVSFRNATLSLTITSLGPGKGGRFLN